ncbi:hypothetical protein LRR80_00624 [Streptomyces sp. RO-S4]|nr:hypothetical protein [Streptomyces sp. RO-S4]
MSTEARRASLPPRPSVPPRPAQPPAPASPPDARARTSGGPGLFDPRAPRASEPTEPAERTADGREGDAPGVPSAAGARGSAPDPGVPSAAGARGPAPDPGVPSAAGARGPAPDPGVPSAAGARGPVRDPAPRTPEAPSPRRDTSGHGADVPRPRFPRIGTTGTTGTTGTPAAAAPPPPRASARFPDAPPTVGQGMPSQDAAPPAPSVPPRPAVRPGAETPSETTARLRPVPPAAPEAPTAPSARRTAPADRTGTPAPHRAAEPDPALSWSAPMAPGGVPGGRPTVISFGEPERYAGGGPSRPFARRTRAQVVAAAVCLVLGTGLIGGAVTGAWLADGPEGPGTRHAFTVAGDLWHDVPVDQLFPPTVQGGGAGPGEADRVWTRIAVAPDSGCKGAFDALLTRVLTPVGCERLLRATYTDATQSHVTTVGLLFTEADAAGMKALAGRFDRERLDRRGDLVPLPYAAKGTAAEGFGPEQRASWAISVLTDAPVVVYAVSGWADGRTVDEPQPAEDAMGSGATTAPAQAGLGHEARGLADRFERALRKRAGSATERPS